MLTPAYSLTASERTLPAMALDFTTGVLDPRVTFTRSSTGTYTNSLGLIATAAINEPRFDYNSTTLTPKGLMLEEARTNLATYSEDITNAAWLMLGTAGASRTANATTAPDGTSNADRYTVGTGSGAWYIANYANQNITNGQAYTFSVYVKANGLNYVFVRPHNNTINLGSSGFIVSLIDGTITYPSAPVAPASTGTATNVGNGWWRITATSTATGTVTPSTGGPGIWPCNSTAFSAAGGTGPANFTGNGTSGVYIWGAQLEAGAFATSYIPTVASTVTRSADAAAMTGTNFSSWYSQNAGTFVAGFQTYTSAINLDIFMANSGAPLTNSIGIYSGTSGDVGWCRVSGATQAAISSGVVVANTPHKTAFAYATNDFAISAAGGVVVTDTSGSLPSPNRLTFGANNIGSGNQGMWLRSLAFYNLRLSNAVLQSFAT